MPLIFPIGYQALRYPAVERGLTDWQNAAPAGVLKMSEARSKRLSLSCGGVACAMSIPRRCASSNLEPLTRASRRHGERTRGGARGRPSRAQFHKCASMCVAAQPGQRARQSSGPGAGREGVQGARVEKTRVCMSDFFHYVELFPLCSHSVPTLFPLVTAR